MDARAPTMRALTFEGLGCYSFTFLFCFVLYWSSIQWVSLWHFHVYCCILFIFTSSPPSLPLISSYDLAYFIPQNTQNSPPSSGLCGLSPVLYPLPSTMTHSSETSVLTTSLSHPTCDSSLGENQPTTQLHSVPRLRGQLKAHQSQPKPHSSMPYYGLCFWMVLNYGRSQDVPCSLEPLIYTKASCLHRPKK